MAEARQVLAHAHAPYSRFPVGAVLRARSGRTYRGVNVENASLGLSVCAERAAVFAAVAAGERVFDTLAVATDSPGPTPPCGACRQVLLEFSPEVTVLYGGRDGRIERHKLAELVPYAFRSYASG